MCPGPVHGEERGSQGAGRAQGAGRGNRLRLPPLPVINTGKHREGPEQERGLERPSVPCPGVWTLSQKQWRRIEGCLSLWGCAGTCCKSQRLGKHSRKYSTPGQYHGMNQGKTRKAQDHLHTHLNHVLIIYPLTCLHDTLRKVCYALLCCG